MPPDQALDIWNIERAALSLWRSLEGLPHLPFVTDEELELGLPPDVIRALDFLDCINKAQSICSRCGGKCCHEMGCELYAPEMGGCPIACYRPVLCRFHYCERFGHEHEGLVKGLRDLLLSAASHPEETSREASALELNVLLYRASRKPEDPCPQLVEDMHRIMDAARRGEMGWQQAKEKLTRGVETHRTRAADIQLDINHVIDILVEPRKGDDDA